MAGSRGVVIQREEDTVDQFGIRPSYETKFKPYQVKELIVTTLNDTLGGKLYDPNKVSNWCKFIADSIKNQVKTLGYDRYKIVVEVVIGEQRGEGVRMGSRCLWDSDTDNYASDVYMNDSLFCCTAVFGLYYY